MSEIGFWIRRTDTKHTINARIAVKMHLLEDLLQIEPSVHSAKTGTFECPVHCKNLIFQSNRLLDIGYSSNKFDFY